MSALQDMDSDELLELKEKLAMDQDNLDTVEDEVDSLMIDIQTLDIEREGKRKRLERLQQRRTRLEHKIKNELKETGLNSVDDL